MVPISRNDVSCLLSNTLLGDANGRFCNLDPLPHVTCYDMCLETAASDV